MSPGMSEAPIHLGRDALSATAGPGQEVITEGEDAQA